MISVITICYNDLAGLKKTIASVKAQTCEDIEHLIIDGGSTDGCVELIETHKQQFSYVVSESDRGVYAAMNKGIEAAKGDYVFFLNSGDEFRDASVLEVFQKKTTSKKDIYYGDIQLVDGNGTSRLLKTPAKLSFDFFFRRTIPHQASLIKRSLFETIFYYNESLKIVSDWEFFVVAICKEQSTYEHVGITVSNYDTNGMSSAKENRALFKRERKQSLHEHFASFVDDYQDLRELRAQMNRRDVKILSALRPKGTLMGITKLWLSCANRLSGKKV